MVDIRIIPVDKTTRKIYVQFEQDLSMTEVEYIYKNCQKMTQNIQVFQPAEEEFMGISYSVTQVYVHIVDIGFIVPQIFMMSLKQMSLLVCAIYIIILLSISIPKRPGGESCMIVHLHPYKIK